MSVTLASIVGRAAARTDEHPLLVPTLRDRQPRLEAHAWRLAPLEYDLRQEFLAAGARAVAHVVQGFDPLLGVPLAAVATQQALYQMRDVLRQSPPARCRQTLRFAEDDSDNRVGEVDADAALVDEWTPLEVALLSEAEAIIARAVGCLTAREAQVVRAPLVGDSQADIARAHQVSRMAVSKWVATIRRNLGANLQGEVYSIAA